MSSISSRWKRLQVIAAAAIVLSMVTFTARAAMLHAETAGQVTVTTGVNFNMPYPKLTLTFSGNKTFSVMTVGSDALTIDGVGVGGYIDSPGVTPPWSITITGWTGSATQQDPMFITYNVSASIGTVTHQNITGYYAEYLTVGGVSKTDYIWHLSNTHASYNWTSSGSTTTFVWTVVGQNPIFLGGVDPMTIMTDGLYIFGFITVITLGLMVAWRLKQWRGG